MNKELNIIEASNMPIGTEFNVICVNGIKICNKVHFNEYGELCDTEDWKIQINSLLLNSKFIPLPKPVGFMETKELFGEMTYLSKEGQEEYTSVLNNIFRDTGINLL